jgi:hypothetical protein
MVWILYRMAIIRNSKTTTFWNQCRKDYFENRIWPKFQVTTIVLIQKYLKVELWIRIKLKGTVPRIRMDPKENEKLEADPDPHQFADDKPKCMKYEPI